jgi:hypothetical protein
MQQHSMLQRIAFNPGDEKQTNILLLCNLAIQLHSKNPKGKQITVLKMYLPSHAYLGIIHNG